MPAAVASCSACAKSPDQVAGIDRNDLTRREKFCQGVQRDAVVGIVEHWREHNAIRNVEIGVTRRQSPAFEDNRTAAWEARRCSAVCRPDRARLADGEDYPAAVCDSRLADWSRP